MRLPPRRPKPFAGCVWDGRIVESSWTGSNRLDRVRSSGPGPIVRVSETTTSGRYAIPIVDSFYKATRTMTVSAAARHRLFESLGLRVTDASVREPCEPLEYVNAVAEYEQCRGDHGASADAINALIGFAVCGDPAAVEAARPYVDCLNLMPGEREVHRPSYEHDHRQA
jgi:hypothetical protein